MLKGMTKRVLVTGAAGFIGRHALRSLTVRGFSVHAVLGPGDPVPEGDVAMVQLDLHDHVAVTRRVAEVGASHLLHLAWYASIDDVDFNPVGVATTGAGVTISTPEPASALLLAVGAAFLALRRRLT